MTYEQREIIQCNDDIAIVEAYAGTGKTKTLVDYAKARTEKKILYLVFGKANERDARGKFKGMPHVTVSTLHALAYSEIAELIFSNRKFDNIRALDISELFASITPNNKNNQLSVAQAVLNLFRQYMQSSLSHKEFIEYSLKNKHIITLDQSIDITTILKGLAILLEQLNLSENLSVEHDYYLKLWQLSKPYLEYDCILIDEAQDISDCMIDIVLSQSHAQRLFIGDNFQQIFSWRGASNALQKLSNQTAMYSLTKTFRCPSNIAKEANKYLKLLGAKKPLLSNIDGGYVYCRFPNETSKFTFIARTNAGLLQFIANEKTNKKIFFVGGLRAYNFQELSDIKSLQYEQHNKIFSDFLKKFKTIEELETYVDNSGEDILATKIRTTRMIPNIKQLLWEVKLKTVNKAERADIILTTAHKAKGLEWNNIVLANDFLSIGRKIKNNERKKSKNKKLIIPREELNLIYVAITRAKKELYIPEDMILNDEIIRLASKYLSE